MRTLSLLCTTVVALAIASASALAQPAPTTGPSTGPAKKLVHGMRGGLGGERLRGRMEHRAVMLDALKQVGLSDEQKTKIDAIMVAHRKAVTEFQAAHKDELTAIRQEIRTARQNKDAAALKAAKDKLQPIMQQRFTMDQDFRKQIGDVLTPAQKEQVQKIVADRFMARVTKRLDLTADQQTKVRDILTKAHEDAKAAPTPEARREIMKTAWEKVRTDVLTDAQRSKFTQMHGQWYKGGPKGPGHGLKSGQGSRPAQPK